MVKSRDIRSRPRGEGRRENLRCWRLVAERGVMTHRDVQDICKIVVLTLIALAFLSSLLEKSGKGDKLAPERRLPSSLP